MRAIILALALAGCASAGSEGSQFSSNAAQLAPGHWLVTCYAFASACTERAKALCPAGYEVRMLDREQVRTGGYGAYGGSYGARSDYHMEVTCRAPPT